MEERGALQIEAVITGIHLGTDGKPWVTVSLPQKEANGEVGPEPARCETALSVYIQFPNADIPLNLMVGGPVKLTLGFE